MDSPRSIAVIQTAFLGDIILTSAFLRDLRELYPNEKIIFVTTPAGEKMLSPNPWNIEFLVFDKRGRDKGPQGLWRMARSLRKHKIETVFCIHRSVRSALLAQMCGAKNRIGFKQSSMSFLWTQTADRDQFVYESEKNQALLKVFHPSCELEKPYPQLFLRDGAADIRDFHLPNGDFIVMAPSSVWATKRWPAERFGQVAASLWQSHKIPTIFVAGSEKADLEVSRIAYEEASKLAANASFVNLAGLTNLEQLKAILAKAKIVFANDSAPLHIGVSFNKPTVACFGPTTKSLGFFPYGPPERTKVLEIDGLSCRPCGLHGHHKCPEKHFRCMLDIKTESVVEAVKQFL